MSGLPGSLGEAADALADGQLSAAALVDGCLQRIEDANDWLGALTEVLAAQARARALEIDRRRAAGDTLSPLAGVPIVIKDNIDTTPATCAAGFEAFADHRPEADAPLVAALRRAGAIVVGVGATDSAGFEARTPAVTHPLAPGRSVGGSSGGPAAAVLAGMALAAVGTDTGGSVRIPAACCGLAGFKPTWGRVSTQGVRPLAWTLDHAGPMAPCVRDLRLVMDVLDPRLAATAGPVPCRPRLGMDRAAFADADTANRRAMERVADACRELGAEVVDVTLPPPQDFRLPHWRIFSTEAAAYYLGEEPERVERLPEGPRGIVRAAGQESAMRYLWNQRRRDQLMTQVDALLAGADAILMPTLPVVPPPVSADSVRVGEQDMEFTAAMIWYTCPFNHTRHPVVSLPVLDVAPGVGASVQLVGRRDGDAMLLALAERVEAALGYARRTGR